MTTSVASSAVALSSEENALLDRIEDDGAAMIARVKAWSDVNSGSWHNEGLERMRAMLPEAFAPLEGNIDAPELAPSEIVTDAGEVKPVTHPPAFRLRKRPDAPVQVVLTGHHDTVFPPASAFQSWRMLDEDTINGPGVADMKGGLIVMARALEALERHPARERVGYTVLISPDEEIGSLGSGPLLAEAGARAHVGLTFEPALADGRLAGARKGSGNFAVAFQGRAAHAGREHHLGRNAIEAMSAFVVGLQKLNGQREGVTFNTAKVAGGGPNNVVPDFCLCRFNVRIKEPEDMHWAQGEIDSLIAQAGARDGIVATLHGGFTRPPKPMSAQNAAVFDWTRAAGSAIGVEVQWADTGGVCEGNNLWAVGCPNVDTLGVRGGKIHSDEEFAILSSFPERAKLAAVMLFKIAEGAFDAPSLRALG